MLAIILGRHPAAWAVAALLLLAGPARCRAQSSSSDGFGLSLHGCACSAACARTVDSPLKPWCPTSGNVSATCGLGFSVAYNTLWDWCSVDTNATGAGGAAPQLETFREMWSVMTASAVTALAGVYLVAGCAAAALATGWPPAPDGEALLLWLWLPGLAALLGSCHAMLVGAVLAALLSLLYLSVPYAIDVRVAVAMGVGIAALLAFGALGRHARKSEGGEPALHASELER